MEKINNIIYDIKQLHDNYNEAYQSYLNNISPIIFMNDFLDKLIKITQSKSGYIMSIYQNSYLILEAINKNIFKENEFFIQNNNMIDLKIESIVTSVAKTGIYIITNDCINHPLYKEPLNSYSDITTYVCYPIKYLDKIIGVIGLANAQSYNLEILDFLKETSCLLSILMNNYLNNKITNNKRFVSFQLMDEIVNNTNDGILIISNNGDILYHNNLGINFIKNIINDNYTKNFLDKNLIELVPQFDFIKHNGEITENKVFKNKSINLEVSDLNNKTVNYSISINSVITNNILHHIFLIQEKENSENLCKNHQNNLVAFLSHELRNPLQSLTMAIHLLQKKIDIIDNDIIKSNKIDIYLNTISKSSGEMKRIINDILDLSKLESNEIELILDNHNTDEIINDLIDNFKILAKEKNINLSYTKEKFLPKNVFTDITRINQILSNLLSNAIKYSKKDSSIIINASYSKKNHGITFDIIDSGIGISKEEYNNIFKENGTTSNSYKFDVKSNGLGLYLSQKIAHLLDGKITFKSEYGKGSIFSLFLPIKLGMSVNSIKNKLKNVMHSGKILIVEDDLSNLTMFRLLLENISLEYKIDLDINSVQDGQTAIDLCKVNKYDIIFMDINMVGIDGCTATKIIKENYSKKNIKSAIIATTGNILAKKENQNFKTSDENKYICFDNIIIKPYDEQNILSILNSYLT